MPVGELCHRMSAHELAVIWPAYFAYRHRQAERDERQQAAKAPAMRGFGG